MRAVVAARVSVLKGAEKVSHQAQHEAGVRYVNQQGWDVAGTVEDLDVSAGKLNPWQRPDLSPWLAKESLHKWDALVFTKVDRAFRSTYDCVQFAKWMKENRKILVFAQDGLTLNYRDEKQDDSFESMMAEFFVYVGSFFAQIELNRFKTRSEDAHSALRETNRWAGGIPPEGYKTTENVNGGGRILVPDPSRKAMIEKMGEKILSGESYNSIAIWLNEEGYETTMDYWRAPEKKKGTSWKATQVKDILKSLGTQGVKLNGRGRKVQPTLDENGNYIQMAEPIFDAHTWKRIQDATNSRNAQVATRVRGANPLLGVVFCGKCKSKAARRTSKHSYGSFSYYNCANYPSPCTGVNNKADDIEGIVEEEFLKYFKNEPVTERIFVPGEDHTEDLENIEGIIESLRQDRKEGLFKGEKDEERFRLQMKSLLARREQLEAMPQREAHWDYVETGDTYGEAWKKADVQQRRKLLIASGIYIELYGKNNTDVFIPEDVKERMREATSETVNEDVQATFEEQMRAA